MTPMKQIPSSRHLIPGRCILALFGSVLLGFGLYNIHSLSGVTEGGVLGLTLLLQHWFSISPAISGFVFNAVCYAVGWRTLGREFLCYSFLASAGFSVTYRVCEILGPVWPGLSDNPLLAAVLGALFVGISVGLCVRAGGAPTGDDALAMSLSHAARINIRWVYLVMDLVVLGLSLTYIPFSKIIYSLLSVILSGQIVGWMQWTPRKQ